MVRLATLTAALWVGSGAARAAPTASPDKPVARETAREAKAKPSVVLRSLDLDRRLALVEVSGLAHAPNPNLFTFTDVRDRHYIAINIHCDEPFPSGIRVCQLEIPLGYERAKLVGLDMHVNGLKGRTVSVAAGQVSSAWDHAELARQNPSSAPPPTATPTPTAPPAPLPAVVVSHPTDGGAARDAH